MTKWLKEALKWCTVIPKYSLSDVWTTRATIFSCTVFHFVTNLTHVVIAHLGHFEEPEQSQTYWVKSFLKTTNLEGLFEWIFTILSDQIRFKSVCVTLLIFIIYKTHVDCGLGKLTFQWRKEIKKNHPTSPLGAFFFFFSYFRLLKCAVIFCVLPESFALFSAAASLFPAWKTGQPKPALFARFKSPPVTKFIYTAWKTFTSTTPFILFNSLKIFLNLYYFYF